MASQALVDWTPALRLALLAGVIALLPLSWWWLRQRGADAQARLAALAAITLFLTFDLVVFGAFTRLSDSGLGCPDWPGCYAAASPLGAHAEINAAQAAAPGGPVSWNKAWIEMIHRYLAMTVGVLIVVMTAMSWRLRRALPFSPWWTTSALAWVLVQGLFGRYTVTLKLYPLVVTLHLLGGMVLLVLLAVQHAAFGRRAIALPVGLLQAAFATLAVVVVQIALGGWVSSNYAVLACSEFPQCRGEWWPAADFSAGFTLLRGLGEGVTLDALVAIHLAHRVFALLVAAAVAGLAWRLWRSGIEPAQRFGAVLAGLLVAQLASGLSNVVLGWPLVAALAHTAGAAALVVTLSLLLARSTAARATAAVRPAAVAVA